MIHQVKVTIVGLVLFVAALSGYAVYRGAYDPSLHTPGVETALGSGHGYYSGWFFINQPLPDEIRNRAYYVYYGNLYAGVPPSSITSGYSFYSNGQCCFRVSSSTSLSTTAPSSGTSGTGWYSGWTWISGELPEEMRSRAYYVHYGNKYAGVPPAGISGYSFYSNGYCCFSPNYAPASTTTSTAGTSGTGYSNGSCCFAPSTGTTTAPAGPILSPSPQTAPPSSHSPPSPPTTTTVGLGYYSENAWYQGGLPYELASRAYYQYTNQHGQVIYVAGVPPAGMAGVSFYSNGWCCFAPPSEPIPNLSPESAQVIPSRIEAIAKELGRPVGELIAPPLGLIPVDGFNTAYLMIGLPTEQLIRRVTVYRTTRKGKLGLPIAVDVTEAVFEDPKARYGRTYYYTVKALDQEGKELTLGRQVAVKPRRAPLKPKVTRKKAQPKLKLNLPKLKQR